MRRRKVEPLQLEEIHLPHATLIVPRPADALLLRYEQRATRTSEKFIEDAFAVNAGASAAAKWACRGKVCVCWCVCVATKLKMQLTLLLLTLRQRWGNECAALSPFATHKSVLNAYK